MKSERRPVKAPSTDYQAERTTDPLTRRQLIGALIYVIEDSDVKDRYVLGCLSIALDRVRARRRLVA